MTQSIDDPERGLALAYAPAAVRAALAILWALDERLGAITLAPNPSIAAIKLAWWREALEALDSAPPPAEPLLRAVAGALLPLGVSGARLASIAEGWDALLDGEEDAAAMLARHARLRGGGLFTAAADLLGGAGGIDVAAAGAVWALLTLAPPFGEAATLLARERRGTLPRRWPARLRAIGVLAMLARDQLAHPGGGAGSPRRVARALWHALSGF